MMVGLMWSWAAQQLYVQSTPGFLTHISLPKDWLKQGSALSRYCDQGHALPDWFQNG